MTHTTVHAARRSDGFDVVTADSLLPTSDADQVWARITSPAGINAELAPLLRMPSDLTHTTLDEVPLNQRLGRAWVLFLGVLPVDFDDLRIVERGDRRFLERSSTSSSRIWQHERAVSQESGGVRVRDRVTFAVRGPLRPARRVYLRVVTALFRHRHRRLTRHYETSASPSSD
jgi:ligand-binding SRPBCC domain-containing protein